MEINKSNLFYTCSLLELIGRVTKQKRRAVVRFAGEKIIRDIYEHSDTLQCEEIEKNADYFIEACRIPVGEYDNAACKHTVPGYREIGKVYAQLVEKDIYKIKLDGGDPERREKLLAEAHRSYAFLQQDEQKIAENYLHKLERGEVKEEPGISFMDYIIAEKVKAENEEIHSFAETFGLDEVKLQNLISAGPTESNINQGGRYNELISTWDEQKVKAYFEAIDGAEIPLRKIYQRFNIKLMKFILHKT